MIRPVLVASLVALGLAGCGGEPQTRSFPDRVVEIDVEDYRQHPGVVRVPRGRITFRVTNGGRLPHNFGVRGERAIRLQISTMLPGETSTGTVKLGRGEYRMFCAVGHHEELGEHGLVIVE